ncbi:unnamed protein product, partial [Mesorhabditis spiculigera]
MARNIFFLLSFIVHLAIGFGGVDYLANLVQISTGLLQGIEISGHSNTSGLGFLGIPIAEPPVGRLRLKKPIPVSKWDGVMSARQYRNACISNPVRTYKRDEGGPVSEDCLYLNVFTNRKCLKMGGCAVLVAIHGGAYVMESPAAFPAEVIVNNFPGQDRNVIVVMLPYRLGILGWFNLPESGVPPNLALYDIKIGLEWVQREIHNFGGDNGRVTLYGHSAGAQMVDPISLTPKMEGLFQAVISQSGNAARMDVNKNINVSVTRRMLINLGCATEDAKIRKTAIAKKALDCILAKSADEIKDAQIGIAGSYEDFYGISLDDYFFTKPYAVLAAKRKQLPTLVGTVTGEMNAGKFIEGTGGMPDIAQLTWVCEAYAYGFGFARPEVVAQMCVEEYNQPNKTRHIFDDAVFYMATIVYANSQLSLANPNVFVYSYRYADAGLAYDAYQKDRSDSPLHSEDFIYIFGMHRGIFKEKDYEVERIYTEILANFVKYHSPSFGNVSFPRYTTDGMEHLVIDFDKDGQFNGGPAVDYYRHQASGGRAALTNYPPGFDNIPFQDVIDYLASVVTGISHGDKSTASQQLAFTAWARFVEAEKRKRNRAAAAVPFLTIDPIFNNSDENGDPVASRFFSLVDEKPKHEEAATPPVQMWSTIAVIGGVLAVLAVGMVVLMKYLVYKRRNTYHEI